MQDAVGYYPTGLAIELKGSDNSECRKNARFDSLGFVFRWGYDRKGRPHIKKRTSRQKLHKSIVLMTTWCREHRNLPVREIFRKLNSKLRGYYNHYGMIGNYKSLSEFFYHVNRILCKWLNRRSERKSYNWASFNALTPLDICPTGLTKEFNLWRPRITEPKNYQLKLQYV